MHNGQIALTDEERNLLAIIGFRTHVRHDELRAACQANKEPILALWKSLSERNAVPAVRLRYWNDPDYNKDDRASHREIF